MSKRIKMNGTDPSTVCTVYKQSVERQRATEGNLDEVLESWYDAEKSCDLKIVESL
jgi:hypothetical protein